MALARTNAIVYSDDNSGDLFTISSSVVFLNTIEDVTDIILGNEICILRAGYGNEIFVSDDGENFQSVTIGNDKITDIIFLDDIGIFCASCGNRIYVSNDGKQWSEGCYVAIDTSYANTMSILALSSTTSMIYACVAKLYTNGQGNVIVYSINKDNVSNSQRTMSATSIKFDTTNAYMCNTYKCNNRSVVDLGTIKLSLSGSTCSETKVVPSGSCNGYFISTSGNTLLRSADGIEYAIVGSCQVKPITALFFNNKYYVIGETHMCRADMLYDATLKSAEEYVRYEDTNTTAKAAVSINEKIILLCKGYILILTIKDGTDNPVVQTIKTLSAKAALIESKKYTDEIVEDLKERIAALESNG